MNQKQLERNEGRIPRLVGHIARCKKLGQPDRVDGFSAELKRRGAEMKAAGHGDQLKELLETARSNLRKTG